MDCPFCSLEMCSIDSGSPPPRQTMVWVCRQCPQEVRVGCEKVADDTKVRIRTVSILVSHHDRKYCLLWDYCRKVFKLLDVAAYAGSGYIMRMEEMPTGITPENALDKLKLYLMFQ